MQSTHSQSAERLVEPDLELFGLMLEAGYIYLETRQYERARTCFEGVRELLPNSEVPMFCIGCSYFAESNLKAALKAQLQAIQINPQAATPHAHAAEVLLFMGKPDEAQKHLDKAFEVEPDSTGAQFAKALQEAKDLGVFSRENLDKAQIPRF